MPSEVYKIVAPDNHSPLGLKHGVLVTSGGGVLVPAMDTNGGCAIKCAYSSSVIGGSFTEIANIAVTGIGANSKTDNMTFNACIDADDGLHLSWVNGANDLRYAYYAYNSGANNWGAAAAYSVALFTAGAATMLPRRVDLDTAGTTDHRYTVVAAYFGDNGGGVQYRTYVVNDTAHTVSSQTVTLAASTKTLLAYTPDIAVACAKVGNGVTLTQVQFAVTGCVNLTSGDTNDFLHTWTFTVSGSTFTAGPTVAMPVAGKGSGYRAYFFFCQDGTNEFLLAAAGGTNFWMVYSFTFDSSSHITQLFNFSINNSNVNVNPSNSITFGVKYLPGVGASGSDKVAFYGPNTFGNAMLFPVATITTGNTVSWRSATLRFADTQKGANCGTASAGTNRNFTSQNYGVACWMNDTPQTSGSESGSYMLYYDRMAVSSYSTVDRKPAVVPTLTQTSYPVLESSFKLPRSYAQNRMKMMWQIATDSGFSTIFDTETQPDSALQTPINTDAVNLADVRATYTATNRIPTGTYWVRSRIIDDFGNISPWSAGRQVQILHAPNPTGETPGNNKILPWNGGVVYMNWNFTDPDPTDYQTAYEIAVSQTDGTTVIDSGKIMSATSAGSVTIPAPNESMQLQWQLYVWDADNTRSTLNGPFLFYASEPPTPTILSPTDGSSITTGRPTVTWNPGNSDVNKTQVTYHLTVQKGNAVVYDSGVVASSAASVRLPSGVLHNLLDYTIKLTVKDSLNQTGSTTSQFSTFYTPPDTVYSASVYLYEFDRKGFVYVGWDWTTRDAAFLSWNLYRQQIGGAADVVLLAKVTEMRPVYGFRDYSAKANTTYQYWVTQTVLRSGDLVESSTFNTITVNTPGNTYWLLDTLGVVSPVPLFIVTGDTWTVEHEENVVGVLGRGRHVDTGDTWGANGSLSLNLRDAYMGMGFGYNWLGNPSCIMASDGSNPDNWSKVFSNATGLSWRWDNFIEPAPNWQFNLFTLSADTVSNGGYIGLNNTNLIDLTKTDMWPAGQTVFMSAWFADPPAQSWISTMNIYYRFWNNRGDTVVASGSLGTSVIDSYIPAGQGDTFDIGNWVRRGASVAVPAGAYYLTVEYRFVNNTGVEQDSVIVYFGGFSVSGNSYVPYFDGDMFGGTWISGRDAKSGSSSTGYFTAFQQRKAIERMRELKRPLWMRDPYGQITRVAIGDEGSERIPGVGASDFQNYTIPYQQVAY